MTKRRLPLTFENALTKVAAKIGWDETAAICGAAARTVRNWSEPDTTAGITLEAALKLDIAHHLAGGNEAPFLTCYAMRLDVESMRALPGREALIAAVGKAGKECGEAVSATLHAARPSATKADFIAAEKEIEESIVALQDKLRCLRARKVAVETGEGLEEVMVPGVAAVDTS